MNHVKLAIGIVACMQAGHEDQKWAHLHLVNRGPVGLGSRIECRLACRRWYERRSRFSASPPALGALPSNPSGARRNFRARLSWRHDMKRVLPLVLVAGAAFLFGHFLRAPMPQAGAAGGAVPLSGDANGDGKVDISDGIYIINNQFRGGPAPVPIVCPPMGLPATGQTKCYDEVGNEIDCTSADFPGQDGFHQAGCPGEGRFVDNGDGTVTDTCTGLMWQKDTADVNGNGSIGDEDGLDWQAALKHCESLSYAGHDDWRLPNVRELQSILHYGRGGPAIDPVFGALSAYYWSSSVVADVPGYSWLVQFGVGYINAIDGRSARFNVRAVRNAP
jgi:hypothetical protein